MPHFCGWQLFDYSWRAADIKSRRFDLSFSLSNITGEAETEVESVPVITDDETPDMSADEDVPWVVLVWNDPINLMSYVTHVLQKLFGYSTEKATQLMLDVHNKGRAVVSNGTREKAELDVFRLHEYGLWAPLQKDV